MSIDKQRRILERKPEVIIATPGRLWQLFEEVKSLEIEAFNGEIDIVC